jgi:hypothetical protein
MVTVDVELAVAVGAMLPKLSALALIVVQAAPVTVAVTVNVPVRVPACSGDSTATTKTAATIPDLSPR